MERSSVTRGRFVWVLACAAAVVIAWLAASELTWLPRLWTAFLLVILPAALVLQARGLREVTGISRMQMYASSIATLWILAILTIAAALRGGYGMADLALRAVPWGSLALWAFAATIVAELLVLGGHLAGIRASDTLRHLLPVTRRERAVFAVVAATAGICEEIVFRGFLVMVLTAATHAALPGVLLAAIAFGVLHAYQDVPGVAVSALLAVVLTIPVLVTGSLYPSIVAHFAIDIIGGYWLGPALMRRQ